MTPNCIAYEAFHPALAEAPRVAQPGHALVGRVTLGRRAWLGAGSVMRADGHFVRVGDDFHLGRGATVHIAHERYPAVIGDRVSAGVNAVIHACAVGDDVVVEEDCVILDGAEVGAGAVLEAGSYVYPRAKLEGGQLYAGRPARPVRALDAAERAARAEAVRRRNETADAAWPVGGAAHAAPDAFVAGTVHLAGEVHLGAGASVWYGCRLDAGAGAITLAPRCNVQDNSVLRGRVAIGEDSTIGHNVELTDCTVGARCLVGIGSRIAPGTVIPDDTFVAGGCVTTAGQVLLSGRVWAGGPARAIGEMDDDKRRMIIGIATVYGHYARVLNGHPPSP